MKKIILMLFVASWAFVQMSCSKESPSTTTVTQTLDKSLVSRITDATTSEYTAFTYDTNKRLVSQKNDSMGKVITYNFTWTDANTGTIEINNNGTVTNGGTFYVNNSGYPTLVTIGTSTQGYKIQNQYNSDGTAKTSVATITLDAQTSITFTTNFEYSGGNLVKTTSTNSIDPSSTEITQYTYHTDVLNNIAVSKAKGILNMEEPGIGSKNLVKTKTTSTSTTVFTPTIASNRITQIKEVETLTSDPSNPVTTTTRYSYY